MSSFDLPTWLVVVLVSLPPVIAVWVLVWSLCVAARIGDEALQHQSVDDDWGKR